MVVIAFLIINKANWVKFFEETFLVANISLDVVFRMSFLTLSDTNVDFLNRELRWKIYTFKKAPLTTRHVELMEKKKFAATTLNPKHETFVVYIVSLSSIPLNIYSFHKPQISNLTAEKAPISIKVFNKYVNFTDVFSPNLTFELSKHTRINDHALNWSMVNKYPISLFIA